MHFRRTPQQTRFRASRSLLASAWLFVYYAFTSICPHFFPANSVGLSLEPYACRMERIAHANRRPFVASALLQNGCPSIRSSTSEKKISPVYEHHVASVKIPVEWQVQRSFQIVEHEAISTTMRIKSAVKLRCQDCRFVKRKGRLFVVCKSHPRVCAVTGTKFLLETNDERPSSLQVSRLLRHLLNSSSL